MARADLASLQIRAKGHDAGTGAVEPVSILIVHGALRRLADRGATDVAAAHPGIGVDEAVVLLPAGRILHQPGGEPAKAEALHAVLESLRIPRFPRLSGLGITGLQSGIVDRLAARVSVRPDDVAVVILVVRGRVGLGERA